MIQEQRDQALGETVARRKDQAKRWIYVTFQKVGFHKYPAAGTDPALCSAGEYDVSYLAARHRHLFKFKVQLEIFHNDREIEFHQALIFCESLFKNTIEIDYKSVEMLADDLYDQLAVQYPNRDMKIEVAEDGECGCVIEYNQTRPMQTIKI
jgi:hypothetical protein